MRILVTGGSGFIGTNYIEHVTKKYNCELLNIDIKPSLNREINKYYTNCDIMDHSRLKKIVKEFKPTHVVHLAAKTGAHKIKSIDEFGPNIQGVVNLINSLSSINTVERVIFTSTLLVCKVGYIPKSDTDYLPTTAYGESKVEGEKIVRNWKNIPFEWTIIRPISVWGPWMIEPYLNFFKAINKGWYLHIGKGHFRRSMGYVENIAYEIQSILLAKSEMVNKKTFYVGDPDPVDLYHFAEKVRAIMNAPKIRNMPYFIAKSVAILGDVLKFFGWHDVPLTSFRLNNIMTEYVFDLSPILKVSGSLPYTIEEGIERSVEWMKKEKII